MTTDVEPIVKNAATCGICGAPADRYAMHFECQANPCHVSCLNVLIFTDLTDSTQTEAKEDSK